MSTSAFARFWQTDLTREAFLEYATQDDLRSLRLLSRDIAEDVATTLFKTLRVNFDISTFSRRSRMLGLHGIGHHIKHFQFILPHSDATFLPPLIDPETLNEITFQYEAQNVHTSRPSSSSSSEPPSLCKYGSWEMNDLLVRQYPPLFHAATNITSFVRAFNAMPCLRHLTISCPDLPTGHRYRRSAVDYALTSLRLAIEVVNPPFLDTFSLDPIYSGAIFYLRPQNGIGTCPASTRIWHRIKNVEIKMQNFADTEDDTTDHLKILHTYLQIFRSMEKLSFTWLACRPIKFRKLRSMKLENATLDASQASRFITTHRKCVRHIDFASCTLRSGTWDDALAPLEQMAVNDDWRSEDSTSTASSQFSEVMEVPIVYTPVEEISNPMECVQELLWDQTDKDIMRAVNKVANDVFKHVAVTKKRDVLACGLRSLFRSFRTKWP
ncbi:hypothetical protein LTR70_009561 [Exophiala xenobiotica]|uniref:Uncharacterized protein n=1 Tax=Lithohypha guttulata TaxID=1690604 RepID=A0ABR0JWY0_9EURO|nr:hypothetical protein LTR24_009445 [Lithohypha guttulata]KAK5310342.1 hypothetical protein LTR70_009561 [Exophiala xenobiotica]